MTASTLLATVGTSLLGSGGVVELRDLLARMESLDWAERSAGAELNSLALLQRGGYVDADCRIHYFVSDSPEGQLVGQALQRTVGEDRVILHTVRDLDPRNPDRFARFGLARLAQEQCRVLSGLDKNYCALDATGGFKAQAGIAVSLGQALQIPVYYRHETFDRIISLPPLPLSLDTELWCRHAALFFELSEGDSLADLPADPRLRGLLEWVQEDDHYLVGLNSTGMIFHEMMRQRWPEVSRTLLPRAATKKSLIRLADHGWPDRQRLLDTMQKLLDRVPYVTRCHGAYLNKGLTKPSTFLIKDDCVHAYCSDGTYTAGFAIRTTARGRTQLEACLTDLLQRLEEDRAGEWLW